MSLALVEESMEAALVPDAECDEGDEQCSVSLRQLRAGVLAPEEASLNEAQEGATAEERLRERSSANPPVMQGRMGLVPTSLAETLHGKSFYVYHQTSIGICEKIKKEGFRPGRSGWCGGAIYFADTETGTYGEAVGPDSHQGCVIRAKVDMGKIKEMGKTCDSSMTGEKLKAMGYDSIRFNDGAGTGYQYVVYDPTRIKSISIIKKDHLHQQAFADKFNITGNESDVEAAVAVA